MNSSNNSQFAFPNPLKTYNPDLQKVDVQLTYSGPTATTHVHQSASAHK